jgi:hypothetical protein
MDVPLQVTPDFRLQAALRMCAAPQLVELDWPSARATTCLCVNEQYSPAAAGMVHMSEEHVITQNQRPSERRAPPGDSSMVIADAIREAETEYVVFFLLKAYLDTESRRQALKHLPARITRLPVTDKEDARARYMLLNAEFDAAARRGDDKARPSIKEALAVFGAAVLRLQALEKQVAHESQYQEFSTAALLRPGLPPTG